MKTNKDYQNELRALSQAMTRIHKMLLDSEISDLELKAGAEFSAPTKLQMLINAPELAWLRTLSGLMAWTDEVFFQKEPIRPEQMKEAFQKTEQLFVNPTPSEFSSNYRRLMTSLPDLMVEHNLLRTTLKKLEKQ